MKFTIPLITTLLSLLPVLVSGQDDDDPLACRNCKVDVDDSDSRIVYSPAASWTHQTNTPKVEGDQIYYMATNSYSMAEGASATFKFTGVGIEYWAVQPLFNVKIQIDGETLDSGSGESSYTTVVASRAFNTSGDHTITITASTYGTAISSSISLDRFRIDNGSVPSTTSSADVSSTSGTASPSATASSGSRLYSTQGGIVIAGFLMSLLLICAL
ncbi:hypothetical protein GALMADRAFT_252344 [Galerina marginata CBS 339.88]|uniref:CBM6 domain-containing protein n=1 Tax=Galerina marginata (strain CBS 339.88) TaxID=685588 RepID=A0A067SZ90_GALM3|nr:hypothetical protein GALMADRAFT_252344 [Galerina marginata CBS 339.88]